MLDEGYNEMRYRTRWKPGEDYSNTQGQSAKKKANNANKNNNKPSLSKQTLALDVHFPFFAHLYNCV